MTDNDELFSSNDTNGADQERLFDILVGEGKKFPDSEALAKKALHQDVYIAKLESQVKELTQRTNEGKTVDDLIRQLDQANRNPPNATVSDTSGVTRTENSPNKSSVVEVDVEKIAESVRKQLEAKTAAETQRQNIQTVKNALVGLYGENFEASLEALGEAKGLDRDLLDTLAKRSPDKFFKALGIEPGSQKTPVTFNTSGIPKGQTPVTQNSTVAAEPGTMKWFQNLKRTDPKTYNDPRTQLAMHQAALANPTKFFA